MTDVGQQSTWQPAQVAGATRPPAPCCCVLCSRKSWPPSHCSLLLESHRRGWLGAAWSSLAMGRAEGRGPEDGAPCPWSPGQRGPKTLRLPDPAGRSGPAQGTQQDKVTGRVIRPCREGVGLKRNWEWGWETPCLARRGWGARLRPQEWVGPGGHFLRPALGPAASSEALGGRQ